MSVVFIPKPLREGAAVLVAEENSGKEFMDKYLFEDFKERFKDKDFIENIDKDYMSLEEFVKKCGKYTAWHFIGLCLYYESPSKEDGIKELRDYKRLSRVYNFLMRRKILTGV